MSKILSGHLERCAFVYVRQSTLHQVRENTTSTLRQYDLTVLAADLGWEQEKIIVVDQDQARSGATTEGRDGFKRMLSEIAIGNVGAVFSLEASRLARDSSAWHHLLKICDATNTLVIDEVGIYDPCNKDDRLLLGLKGTMSEAELNLIASRMLYARKRKAEDGKLCFQPPIGFIRDNIKNLVLDPDEEVQNVIRLLFNTFDRLSSVRIVVRYFNTEGILFPTRWHTRDHVGDIRWVKLSYNKALAVLHNPVFAGAYAYGRTKSYKYISPNLSDDVVKRVKQVNIDDWEVLILDHHAGYITWEKYLHNKKRIADNRNRIEDSPGAVRSGAALLQGIVICGKCGRRMQAAYPKTRTSPIYICHGDSTKFAASICQQLPGESVNRIVTSAFLEAIEPAQLQLSLSTIERLEADMHQVSRQWELRLEKASYEADVIRRRFVAVDPENRLVARTLEQEWNDKLVALERLKRERERLIKPSVKTLSPLERRSILDLARDLPMIWNAETTTQIERKQLLRYLIKAITATREGRNIHLCICWQTGAHTNLNIAIGVGNEITKTDPNTINLILELSATHTDRQIADHLNEKGILSKKGHKFTGKMVGMFRYKYSIPLQQHGKHVFISSEEGWYTTSAAARLLNIDTKTVVRWCKKGYLEAIQKKRQACRWVKLTPEMIDNKDGLSRFRYQR